MGAQYSTFLVTIILLRIITQHVVMMLQGSKYGPEFLQLIHDLS